MLRDHTEDHIRQTRLFLAKGRALGFGPDDGTIEGIGMAHAERLLAEFEGHLVRINAEDARYICPAT
jgi:hypothetical protein